MKLLIKILDPTLIGEEIGVDIPTEFLTNTFENSLFYIVINGNKDVQEVSVSDKPDSDWYISMIKDGVS